MARQTIYTVGGTVQAGGGVYIKRKADDELLELCKQGEFAFILSSRQVGKSSLMVHTAQELAADKICSVIIDLSALGTSVTQDEWYLGILNEIHGSLNLETDIFGWWQKYNQLGPSQRLTNFFKDVLLTEVKEQVVLFFDEIDSTLSIPFSDDFYVALRAVYNARSTNPDFKRLSFVLVGVAAPSDLISDNRRTPFNIGRRVEIRDFTLAEALPLAEGLGQQAEKVLAWVLQYTGGHPYLTQRLCADLANSKEAIDEQTVANTTERLFTGEQGKQDNNLQFVRDMLSKRSPDVARVLSIYKDVRSGKNVVDDERSITKAHLKLSGLVRSEQGFLRVRNEIYNSVFNLQWVRENTPKNWQRTALISLSAVLGLLILATLGIFINDFLVSTRVNKSIADFISTTSSKDRLTDLAKIYSQSGILSNKDSSLQAAQLFYGLSAKDQLSMLTDYAIAREPGLQKDLVVVIGHLYVTVADVNPTEDNTELLTTMRDSLKNVRNDQKAVDLQTEINSWLDGREKARNQEYVNALTDYTDAINANPNNQATLYERAKVYIALTRYPEALKDLDSAIAKAKETLPSPPNTPVPTESPLPATSTSQASQIAPTGPTPNASQPTANTPVPTLSVTLTPELTSPTCSCTGIVPPDRYESQFTTRIDVLNAVREVINSTPQLQAAIQSNGQTEYTNLQLFGLVSIASSSPSDVSLGGPTVTSSPETAYDFAAQACSGSWFSGAGQLPCPGADGDAEGFVLKMTNPKLESGVTDKRLGILTVPQNIQNGFIQGFFPAFRVKTGDRFQSVVSCEGGARNCSVAFRLDYQIDNDSIRTFWTFRERYDGQFFAADINLSPLAGQDVKFILTVLSDGAPTDDRAQWIAPHIQRPSDTTLALTEGPTMTGTAPTATPTGTSGPGTVPPSSCNKVQLLSDVTIPDGTVILPGATFIKTWRLKNVGSCAWSTSYQLVFFSGEQMGAPASTSFAQNVPVGQTVDVSVNMTAPSAPGSYRGYWMFKDASGALFGTGPQGNRPWWVDIKVSNAPSAAPASTLVISSQSSGVPLVETVNVSTHPDVPAGLKEAFFTGPDSLASSTTTNIVKFNGLTYWAYSYIDNRNSMAIVAYDSSNNIIKQWEKTGARYLWKITVDPKSQTVIFHGQASKTIVMKWSELVP